MTKTATATVTPITKPVSSNEHPTVKFSFEGLLSGRHGPALQALTLGAVNFKLSTLVANHEKLKMPVEKVDTPDSLRDLLALPELEISKKDPVTLDALVNGLVASCVLIKDIASTVDYDSSGNQIRPYEWLMTRCRTPISAIESTYDWRADMTAKAAGEQAVMLGVTDTSGIEAKAKARALAQSNERKAYAMQEVSSVCDTSLTTEDPDKLVEMLLDLDGKCFDGLLLAHSSANAQCTNARRRLEAGQYTVVDPEIVIFSNIQVRDSQPD